MKSLFSHFLPYSLIIFVVLFHGLFSSCSKDKRTSTPSIELEEEEFVIEDTSQEQSIANDPYSKPKPLDEIEVEKIKAEIKNDQPAPASPIKTKPRIKEQEKKLKPEMHIPNSPEFTTEFMNSPLFYTMSKTILDSKMPSGTGIYFYNDKDIDPKALTKCNGFLVAKNLFITNAHCVEEIHDTICENKILVNIKTDNGNKIAGCKKLLYASAYDAEQSQLPDYAILELSSDVEGAHIFEISRKGILPGIKISIHAVDFRESESKIPIARYAPKNCQAIVHSLGTDFHDQPLPLKPSSDDSLKIGRSLVVTLAPPKGEDNCQVHSGNSGSVVVNDKNEVIAVTSGYTLIDEFNKIRDERISINNKHKSQGYISLYDKIEFLAPFKEMVMATNFTCIKFSIPLLDVNYQPSLCDEFKIKYWDEQKKRYLSQNEQQKGQYINYIQKEVVDHDVRVKYKDYIQTKFPNVKFSFRLESKSQAQRLATDFDLSSLNTSKRYLIFSPECKLNTFSSSDYEMNLPIYQVNFLDQFDEYYVYQRKTTFDDIEVYYTVNTKDLNSCP